MQVPSGFVQFGRHIGRRIGSTHIAIAELDGRPSGAVVFDSLTGGTSSTCQLNELAGLAMLETSVLVVLTPDSGVPLADIVSRCAEATARSMTTVLTAPISTAQSRAEWDRALAQGGFRTQLFGFARDSGLRSLPTHAVAVVEPQAPPWELPPDDFRALAFITAYNEADVIGPSIRYLIDQGIDVFLVDNWSDDDTVAQARPYLGKGLLEIETYPSKRSVTYDWADLLSHVEELSASMSADWFIQHDADERRLSPWPGVSLRDGLHYVGRSGFTSIDHTQLDFQPIDNEYPPGSPFEDYFRFFEAPIIIRDKGRLNAWANLGVPVDLASTGGHEVQFEGRRIYPYNFLLKHYPFRSQAHGERKVLRDRTPRWNQEERRRGWHFMYDHVRPGHRFVKDPKDLVEVGPEFQTSYLIECLANIGLVEPPTGMRALQRRVVPFVRSLGLLKPALVLQRWYRIVRRRNVASGR